MTSTAIDPFTAVIGASRASGRVDDGMDSANLKLTAQQYELLKAIDESRVPMPTVILYDVRVRCVDMFRDYLTSNPKVKRSTSDTYRVGAPAGPALTRMKKRGLIEGVRGRDCMDWTMTDLGRNALVCYERPTWAPAL